MKYKRLLADVPSGMVSQIKEGMEIDVRIDGIRDMTKAKVTQIYPLADPERHTVTVKLDLPTHIETKPVSMRRFSYPQLIAMAMRLKPY